MDELNQTPADDQAAAPADAPATTPEAAAAPAKTPVPRAPKLTLSFEGKDTPLLKYAFPVKASKFPVKVNGAVVDAACTEGRGKAYTYLLINNTSFYVPGVLPVDAECSVNFPEGYKFDEAQAVRVSTYKPKVKKDAPAAPAADEQPASEPVAEGPKAARRGRK